MIRPVACVRRLGCVLALGSVIGGCGGGGTGSSTVAGSSSAPSATGTHAARQPKPKPKPKPVYPRVLAAVRATGATGFVPAVTVGGQPAAYFARSAAGVALLSFDQRRVTLALHSGTVDAGASGWRYGPAVVGIERRRLVAAFNGGFKFATGAGGFESAGRVALALRSGLGSIVIYKDGSTDIGSWQGEVPAPGKAVSSVRQNLTLLVNDGRPAGNIDCRSCWGATLGGVGDPARSALGITADGHLIWAGGEHLTPAGLAGALLEAQVVRAVELDINPEWVAAYVYAHRGVSGPVTPLQVLSGQPGVPGQFLSPYGRDFLAVRMRG